MVNRRTLAEAATLTKELEAFVKSGVPHRDESSPVPTADMTDLNVELPPVKPPLERRRRSPRAPARLHKASASTLPESDALLDEVLVPITTKLRRKTVQALRRAYLEQKLRCARPATQQDIVQEAVEYWLKQNGHLCD